MQLSREQSDRFAANGFLELGSLLQEDEVEELRAHYDQAFQMADGEPGYRNLSASPDAQSAVQEAAQDQMLQIMHLGERSAPFRKLAYDSRILDAVSDLIGPNIMLFHDQALYKPAHHGGPIHWHQDNAYWKCRPANLVSCWLTLDAVDEENGAMRVVPGSHLRPLSHGKESNGGGPLLEVGADIQESPVVVVDLPAGGAMLHHCQTLHQTKPNRTDRQRRAFAIHYMCPGTVRGDERELLSVSYRHPMVRARL